MKAFYATLLFLAFALIPGLLAALPGWLAYRREKAANKKALEELERLRNSMDYADNGSTPEAPKEHT